MARAAVLWGPRNLTVENVDVDDPDDFEVSVQVAASGLCHSDYHFVDGTLSGSFPRILGHEVAGIVDAVGSGVTRFEVGDHVVGCFAMSCDECRVCLAGKKQLCPNRMNYWSRPGELPPRMTVFGKKVDQGSGIGGLSDQLLVHEKALVKIRNEMPLAPAAILGCAVLTGTGAVFRTARVERGAQVAVIGCGAIGISIIQAARITGCSRIIAVDVVDNKLSQALRFGATDVINASIVDPAAAARELTDGLGVDFAFEAIGKPTTATQAFDMLGPGGSAVIVGIFSGDVALEIRPRDLVVGEKSLRGSYLGSSDFRTEIPHLVDHYLDGSLLVDEMLSPRIGLDQTAEGFNAMVNGEGLRPIIDFTTTK